MARRPISPPTGNSSRRSAISLPEGPAFQVATENVDPEIATIAGPQLVVPVMNARYALNAANARWGSLYDALYGTDAIPETDGAEKGKGYNPEARREGHRLGARLSSTKPRRSTAPSWARCDGVRGRRTATLVADGRTARPSGCAMPAQFAGYRGDAGRARRSPARRTTACTSRSSSIATAPIGKADPAGISDVVLESALTTIQDCEDSVAAVDAEDKVVVYRNWLGLMKGDLAEEITKGGKTFTRKLNPDRDYTAPDGGDARRCKAAR